MKDIARRRLIFSLPLITTLGAGTGFYVMLSRLRTGSFDPKEIKTPQISLPYFNLERVSPFPSFNRNELLRQTKPIVINFFASWCVPCLTEMAILNQLSHKIDIWGIAYKDNSHAINEFFSRNDNPYKRIAQDTKGDAGIQWGLTGVPESFLVLPKGIIISHIPKPLSERDVETISNTIG